MLFCGNSFFFIYNNLSNIKHIKIEHILCIEKLNEDPYASEVKREYQYRKISLKNLIDELVFKQTTLPIKVLFVTKLQTHIRLYDV